MYFKRVSREKVTAGAINFLCKRDVLPAPGEVIRQLDMASRRQLLLLSGSNVYGVPGYLEWAKEEIVNFLTKVNVSRVLFIPYAIRDYDGYTKKVNDKLSEWGFNCDGIHKSANPVDAVNSAQAVFVGGGNTFQLLKALYDNDLVAVLQKRVLQGDLPYIGSSAGTNVATISINTTNDMPIIYPPTFSALGLVPFNINPHYIDKDPASKHCGETREERINEYHKIPDTPPVLGLREGCLLAVTGNHAVVRGLYSSKLFVRNKEPAEYPAGADVSFLLSESSE